MGSTVVELIGKCRMALSKGIPLWVSAGLVVVAVGLWSGWTAYEDYLMVMGHEYELLDLRAKQRETQISGTIRSVYLMMGTLIDDLRDQPNLAASDQGKLLRNYLRQLPELRNIIIIDAYGKVHSDARDIAIGSDASGRDYFQHHKSTPLSDDFYLPKPFRTFSGLIGYSLSRSYRSKNGDFLGVIVASIDPSFFSEVMALHANEHGLEALLINRQGDIFSRSPRTDHIGDSLLGGVAYTEHIQSGLKTTQHLNVVKFDATKKMSVFQDFTEMPLIIVASQEYGVVFKKWLQFELTNFIRLILLSVTALLLYFLAAKRQRSLASALQKIKIHERDLRQYKSIVDFTEDAVVSKSLEGVIQSWNHGAEKIFGYSSEEAVGNSMQPLIPPDRLNEESAILIRIAKGERIESFETTRLHKTGKLINISSTYSPIINDSGVVTGISNIARDITERKSVEERIGYLATHDSLTGLPNRDLLYDRLSQSLSMARRKRESAAILFLDLDGFKTVNDTYGHEAGDVTLKEAAHRMQSCIRDTDTLARLGGDEFAIILNGVRANDDVESVATKILKWISEEIRLNEERYVHIGVSIGIALYPADGNEMDSLIKAADSAMYGSKTAGKNRYTFFSALQLETVEQKDWVDISGPHLTGHAEIDMQHLEIAQMLNQLSHALQANDERNSIVERLQNLVAYVVRHFEYEEQLMDKFKYPGDEPHRNAHKFLLKEVKSMETRFLQGGEMFVLQWLKDWLIGHIGNSDKQLGEYLDGLKSTSIS